MPYRCKETGLEILGTSELVSCMFPITRDPINPEQWTYTGEEPCIYWNLTEFDSAVNPRSGKFEERFTRSDGEDVFWDQIEWKED